MSDCGSRRFSSSLSLTYFFLSEAVLTCGERVQPFWHDRKLGISRATCSLLRVCFCNPRPMRQVPGRLLHVCWQSQEFPSRVLVDPKHKPEQQQPTENKQNANASQPKPGLVAQLLGAAHCGRQDRPTCRRPSRRRLGSVCQRRPQLAEQVSSACSGRCRALIAMTPRTATHASCKGPIEPELQI